jgi:N-acetylmuramoyl-L-alanine amidase
VYQRPSPNFNDRPENTVIDTVVLHYTDVLSLEDTFAILCDPLRKVSAHYVIDDDGTIYQLVDDEKRAWHAGVSTFKGRDNVNDFSIGIELQNGGKTYFDLYGEWPPYPEVQMYALLDLLVELMKRFSIPIDHIVGHSDIAPGRKIDPGPHFDWQGLRNRLTF